MAGCPSGNPAGTDASTKPKGTPSPAASKAASGAPVSAAPSTAASVAVPASKAPVVTPSVLASTAAVVSAVPASVAASAAPAAAYVQVDRLGRPAINEGLIITNSLAGTWNSVGPDIDLEPAAQPIAAEARAVLRALGNTDGQATTLFNQLLPDVMRIDTLRTSGYASSFGGATPLDNLEASLNIPVGGRMPTDDVMDITLFLIVPDTTPDFAKLRTDNVAYGVEDLTGNKHKDLLTEFPYLAAPN